MKPAAQQRFAADAGLACARPAQLKPGTLARRETHVDFAIQVVPAGRVGDDRAEAFSRPDAHLLVLADGAGGTSGGAAASDAILASAVTFFPQSTSHCIRFLQDLDQQLTTVGQTTAVVLVLTGSQVFGASVGDSSAWLLGPADVTDLTQHQKAKPLLGSGNAVPIGFGPLPLVGRVLIGSDGLFKYAPHERIAFLASSLPLAEAAAALVDAARLRSGALQDDIAVVVAGQQGIAADGLVGRFAPSGVRS
jgi:serine/threonine protein phosphatase PrpC